MNDNFRDVDYRSNIIADFELENLPNLVSMELINFRMSVSSTNTPELKTIYLLNTLATYTVNGTPPPFPSTIEEFYYYTPHGFSFNPYESGLELNLGTFPQLKKVHYVYGNYGYTDIVDTGLNIKNGNNIANDLEIILEFPDPMVAHPLGVDQFYLCLDDDISPQFILNNVKVISTEGVFDGNKIDARCN